MKIYSVTVELKRWHSSFLVAAKDMRDAFKVVSESVGMNERRVTVAEVPNATATCTKACILGVNTPDEPENPVDKYLKDYYGG